MKIVNFFVITLLVCPIIAFGQLKVDPTGVVFKVSNVMSGSTGSSANTSSCFGYDALAIASTSGNSNSAFGFSALKIHTTGIANCAFGSGALRYNTTGSSNTASGFGALSLNTGSDNVAYGRGALNANTSGGSNTSFGTYSLLHSSTSSCNTASGYASLYGNTTGGNNTAYGYYSLYANTTGTYNTAIGYNAGRTNASSLTNTTAIGNSAANSASNQVRIGNTSITSIGGYAGWSNLSDGRAKKNIRTDVPGLAFINLLQPVTYNLDLNAVDVLAGTSSFAVSDTLGTELSPVEKAIISKARADKEKLVYSGFIAQDVEKAAKSLGYDFSGVDAPENDKGTYSLRYAEFVVPLVKSVQELNVQLIEQNNRLQEQINQLTAKLDEMANALKNQNVGVGNVNDAANNFSFSLFPNPTDGHVSVDYVMYVDAQICIELYNMYGQRLKMIVPQQNQKQNQYNVQTSVADLTSGTYIVKATSGNQIESKQLIISH